MNGVYSLLTIYDCHSMQMQNQSMDSQDDTRLNRYTLDSSDDLEEPSVPYSSQ